MSEEIWRPIKGYEGLYEVSNMGRVRSLDWYDILGRKRKGKLIQNTICTCGYCQTGLTKDGKRKRYMTHRLVAEAFIPNPNGFSEINHKDENKLNNTVDNLEWCDRIYNINYGTGHDRGSDKLKKKVYCYDKDFNLIKIYNSAQETSEDGYQPSHVIDVALGKRKTHKNMIFKYEEV